MNEFKSSDFALVAALHSLGFTIVRTERLTESKVGFVFTLDPDLNASVEAYKTGQLCVEPQRFFYSQKFLRTLIHTN